MEALEFDWYEDAIFLNSLMKTFTQCYAEVLSGWLRQWKLNQCLRLFYNLVQHDGFKFVFKLLPCLELAPITRQSMDSSHVLIDFSLPSSLSLVSFLSRFSPQGPLGGGGEAMMWGATFWKWNLYLLHTVWCFHVLRRNFGDHPLFLKH